MGNPFNGALVAGFCVAAVSLQGCQLSIPRHTVGNWRTRANYLMAYEYTLPGAADNAAGGSGLNSCESEEMPKSLRCNGHGHCVEWFDHMSIGVNSTTSLSFCECGLDWADPECGTQRKSQVVAFALSIFLGVFGADQFYLGFIWPYGILKLFTLGGLGVWWIYDVVRIGSSPVMTANNFKVAADVQHWAFVLTVLCVMGFLGFTLSIWSINRQRVQKAREVMLLRSADGGPSLSFGSWTSASGQWRPAPQPIPVGFRGYGTTLPGPGPRIGVPQEGVRFSPGV